jgi:ABC-2 type transport system ATP-binding protein
LARVAGFDVRRYAGWVRPRIGVVPDAAPRDSFLTVGDHLRLCARLRGVKPADADRRIRTLLSIMGMEDRRETSSGRLSAGLRQQISLVRGVLHAPMVLFLDQPTRGLDVRAAQRVRTFLKEWKSEDALRTIVLATNDLDEADDLCDRVAVLDHGRVLACATPSALKGGAGSGARFHLATSALEEVDVRALTAVAGVHGLAHRGGTRESSLDLVLDCDQAMGAVLAALAHRNIKLLTLTKRVVTLRDAFVALVEPTCRCQRGRAPASRGVVTTLRPARGHDSCASDWPRESGPRSR